MDQFEQMYSYFEKVTGGYYCSGTRRKYLQMCEAMVEEYPELKSYYTFIPNAPRIRNRIKYNWTAHTEEVINNMRLRPDAPDEVYSIDCLSIDTCEENFPGLYIVGDIKYDPTYGKIFLIKCGGSNDIGKRMRQYTTHNPMFFHDHTVWPCQNWELHEKVVQNFLARCAIGIPPYSKEWFIVPENTYFKLCEFFKHREFFSAVANGKWA